MSILDSVVFADKEQTKLQKAIAERTNDLAKKYGYRKLSTAFSGLSAACRLFADQEEKVIGEKGP